MLSHDKIIINALLVSIWNSKSSRFNVVFTIFSLLKSLPSSLSLFSLLPFSSLSKRLQQEEPSLNLTRLFSILLALSSFCFPSTHLNLVVLTDSQWVTLHVGDYEGNES